MAVVSQFSTVGNLNKLNATEHQLRAAIAEAELAVSAGIPDAQKALDLANEGLRQVQQLRNVYFPNGTATA